MTDTSPEARKELAAARQRRRRAKTKRIEYYPSPEARQILDGLKTRYHPWNSPTRALNRIIQEWSAQGLAPAERAPADGSVTGKLQNLRTP